VKKTAAHAALATNNPAQLTATSVHTANSVRIEYRMASNYLAPLVRSAAALGNLIALPASV
jgi:hypothetical protein